MGNKTNPQPKQSLELWIFYKYPQNVKLFPKNP